MPSSLTLIQAISPCLIGLSFVLPFVYGWVKRPWLSAITLGWSLFALAFLFDAMLKPVLTLEYLGEDTANEIASEHEIPVIPIILFIGWVLPLVGYFLAKYLRKLKDGRV